MGDMKFFNKNYWYGLTLKLTIQKTLKETGKFNKTEIKDILADCKSVFTSNKSRIIDYQSEFHVLWCSVITAIYLKAKAMNFNEEHAIELTKEIIFSNMGAASIAKYMAKALDKAECKFIYIVNSSKKQEVDFFGKAFIFLRTVDNENKYHLLVKKCFYYDFFKETGNPELMKIACEWDLVSWAGAIDEEKHKVKFERNVTLGASEKVCEFIFERITHVISKTAV
jgi:hypothetical protein